MARTNRSCPDFRPGANRWLDQPTKRRPGLTVRQRYEKGLYALEICSNFRDGHLDNYRTATTGGKSTRRVKQLVSKARRQHDKRDTRERLAD